eukprot:7073404-Prymnesium_polylepis.1
MCWESRAVAAFHRARSTRTPCDAHAHARARVAPATRVARASNMRWVGVAAEHWMPAANPCDAEGSDEQPKKTRKTAGGRVIIKSKEGESYRALHEIYCVLQGGDAIDADMLRDVLTPLVMGALRTRGDDAESIRAANELTVVPFGADTKGMIEGQGGSRAAPSTASSPSRTPT